MSEITINIPFTYELGDDGYWTGKELKTIEDMKDEVRAEFENGVVTASNIQMSVQYEREINLLAEKVKDIERFMSDLGLEWTTDYFNTDYSPEFNDPEDERMFNIKLGEILMLHEILGL